ncbi:MAG: hypothetical protein ACRDXX_19650 [Stackebrandtia sp.]
MSKRRLLALWTIPLVALGIAGAMLAVPAGADEPAAEQEPDYEALAYKWKLEKAAEFDPEAELQFGTKPYEDVVAAANEVAGGAACSISPEAATAVSIAPTWPEVSPSGEPPSPMTLSRYDTQPELGDPEGRAEGLWFHPGIGMWQMDSAGLGNDYTAGEAMDTSYVSGRAVKYIVDKYCAAINGGSSEASARASAWTDWHACDDGACESAYNSALAGVTTVDGVDQYGGGVARECEFGGAAVSCLFVDPAAAQGANWWADPGGGRSPVAAPFYVFRIEGDPVLEKRYWLPEDSGAGEAVVASRPFGGNARDSLTWETGSGFCDVTEGRGDAC